jgi:hypothetical protein
MVFGGWREIIFRTTQRLNRELIPLIALQPANEHRRVLWAYRFLFFELQTIK